MCIASKLIISNYIYIFKKSLHLQKYFNLDSIILLNKTMIYNLKSATPKGKKRKEEFCSIKLGLRIRMCLFNVRRHPTGNHVRELARRPHEHPREPGPGMCVCPGVKPNVERPINPILGLNSPVASELSICTGDYLFPLRARLTDRPANSSWAIDVTGSWLSDGFGDPLSRYRSAR